MSAKSRPARTVDLLAAIAVVALTLIPTPARAATLSSVPAPPPSDDTARPDVVSAQLLAPKVGHRVEATDLRSETTSTFANPDGTWTTEASADPVRVLTAAGWTPLDTSLTTLADGSIGPAQPVVPMALSAGGTADLLRIGPRSSGLAAVGGLAETPDRVDVMSDSLTLRWTASLPAPLVQGSTATYRDVMPGVDFVIVAGPEGLEQRIVLRQRPSSPIQTLRFPLLLDGLTPSMDADGNVQAVDGNGNVVLVIPAPWMWDSAQVTDSGGEPAHSAPVGVGLVTDSTGTWIELSPDTAFQTQADVQYPVTIDPDVKISRSAWAYVDSGFPNQVYYNTSANAPVGTYDGGTHRKRSFFSFSTSKFRGTHVLSATLHTYEGWSWSCSARAVSLWDVTAFGASTTWNQQPSFLQKWNTQTVAKGHDSGCPAGTVNFTATGLADKWSKQSGTTGYLALRADSEIDNYYWKKFGNAPVLEVNYNSYPSVPSAAAVQPCGACSGGQAFTNSTTPVLSARFADPDGTTGSLRFEVYTSGGTLVVTGASPTVSNGARAYWTVPRDKLTPGGYKWRVRGYDGKDYGAWSSWITMTVDTTPPAAPSVSSTAYPQNQWSGKPSAPGSFTFGDSSTDVASYLYALDKTPPGTSTTATSVTLTPVEGWHRLYVAAVDRAGNHSTITEYDFGAGANGGIDSPRVGDRTARSVKLRASGLTSFTSVTIEWRRAGTDTWQTVPAANVTNAGAAVTWPVPVVGGLSPTLDWDVGSTVGFTDGPVQVRANFTGNAPSAALSFKLDQQRFGDDYATEEVGPGRVNVVTGNYELSETDVDVDAWGSDLTVGRVYNSRMPAAGGDGGFGPGWTAELTVLSANQTWVRLDNRGSYAVATDANGGITTFSRTSSGTGGTAYDSEAGAEDLHLSSDATSTTATPTTFTLRDDDGNVTTLKQHGGVWRPDTVKQASGAVTTFKYHPSFPSQVQLVVSPAPATVPKSSTGYDCVSAPHLADTPVGCRSILLTYASTTTATGTDESAWGDYTGRISAIWLRAAAPNSSGVWVMKDTQVAAYRYDSTGRMRAAWDPRVSPALKVRYTYDAAGHVTSIAPAGELPWTITYESLPGETNGGRVARVSRPALPSGSSTSTVTYGVSLGSPYALDTASASAWGQTDLPVDATAIFPPDQVPQDPQAPTGFGRATVDYVDVNGRLVNRAQPGGHIDVQEHDFHGNVIRSLTAANRACAVSDSCAVPDATDPLDHPSKAAALDTHRVYSFDGLDLLEEWGPTRIVALASGDQVAAREHVVNTYDEGAPQGGPFHLLTTQRIGARAVGATDDVDVRTGTRAYDDPTKPATDPNFHIGWFLRKPFTKTVDAGSGRLNLRSTTLFNSVGLTLETRMPAGPAGGDAAATKVVYYTGDTSSGDADCNSRPQWANLLCKVSPAAQPGTVGLPALPVTRTTGYDYLDHATTTTSMVGTTVRTVTTTYDAAGRETDVAVTAGAGTALPAVHTDYDPNTSRAVRTSTTEGGVTSTIVRTYDALGRLTSYQDADGSLSTTSYDLLDRPTQATDGRGTQTYTYDTGVEPRGLLTGLSDSAAGTFTARYDPDGRPLTEGYPNGLEARYTYDQAGAATDLEYVQTAGCSSECTWLEFAAAASVHDQVLAADSTLSQRIASYDAAGRLTEVRDTPAAGGCTIRSYAYDADSNRLSQSTRAPAADGSCDPGAVPTVVSHAYDRADRLMDAGFIYDAFGRITIAPASATGTGAVLTATYYVSDMVRSMTSGSTTRTWTLDPERRLRTATTTVSGSATASRTNHYDTDDDRPAWVAESADGLLWTRNIAGVDGRLGAIQNSAAGTYLQLPDLHGDIVATASLASTVLAPLSTFQPTEFGVPPAGAGSPRYAWLGAQQRETDDLAGIVLMGMRLYAPVLGRFIQPDPEPGGSANAYDYAGQDPINAFDLDGRAFWKSHNFWHAVINVAVAVATTVVVSACVGTVVCAGVVGTAVMVGGIAFAGWAAHMSYASMSHEHYNGRSMLGWAASSAWAAVPVRASIFKPARQAISWPVKAAGRKLLGVGARTAVRKSAFASIRPAARAALKPLRKPAASSSSLDGLGYCYHRPGPC